MVCKIWIGGRTSFVAYETKLVLLQMACFRRSEQIRRSQRMMARGRLPSRYNHLLAAARRNAAICSLLRTNKTSWTITG
jgi:hypothetical protein